MPITYSQTKTHKKSLAYFLCGAFLLLAALLIWVKTVSGATSTSYDPYADGVSNSSATVVNADNAVGGPNGTSASLVGVNPSLTLDMGTGEEGTQTLRLHLGQINAQVNVVVEFLDSNQVVITSESRQLGINPDPSTQNFAYNWTDFSKAYRFIRLSSAAGGGVNVDAVEALGYIGSTPAQDTDGDGRPDRSEQESGTNPLVPDSPLSNNPLPAPPASTSGIRSNDPAAVSGQVNEPPTSESDKDQDQMADAWEAAHGLNPNDPSDAKGDPDHDGLDNLTEYKIDSDPQKYDTDGDGMPDKWEYEHGLSIKANDADVDPDGDYLTNLGEYRHNTDPNKADDLAKVFGKNDCSISNGRSGRMTVMNWLLFILLLGGALVSWLAAITAGPLDSPAKKSSRWYRLRYRLHQKFPH